MKAPASRAVVSRRQYRANGRGGSPEGPAAIHRESNVHDSHADIGSGSQGGKIGGRERGNSSSQRCLSSEHGIWLPTLEADTQPLKCNGEAIERVSCWIHGPGRANQ